MCIRDSVNTDNIKNIWIKLNDTTNFLNRIIKYTPAVTSVDEWTRSDTGVGAAKAAGSHEENGICALFVNPVIIINVIIGLIIILSITFINTNHFYLPVR